MLFCYFDKLINQIYCRCSIFWKRAVHAVTCLTKLFNSWPNLLYVSRDFHPYSSLLHWCRWNIDPTRKCRIDVKSTSTRGPLYLSIELRKNGITVEARTYWSWALLQPMFNYARTANTWEYGCNVQIISGVTCLCECATSGTNDKERHSGHVITSRVTRHKEGDRCYGHSCQKT